MAENCESLNAYSGLKFSILAVPLTPSVPKKFILFVQDYILKYTILFFTKASEIKLRNSFLAFPRLHYFLLVLEE